MLGLVLAGTLAGGCGLRGAMGPVGPATDPTAALRPIRTASRPALRDDGDLASLRDALRQSLAWLEREPGDRRFVFGPRVVTATEHARGLRRLLDLLVDDPAPEVLEQRVLREFEILESVGGEDGRVLVTGYYEPVVDAAESRSAEYSVPILVAPPDLIEVSLEAFDGRFRGERISGRLEGRRLLPYWTRAEIDEGRLAGRGLELAWGRDAIDVFFMEIQGSGTLRLPDGQELRVGYAASNGRPYRSIGRLLVDEGKMEREVVSLQSLRAWLLANLDERGRVLRHNESYVFFRRLDGPPVGSLGVPVTPQRSIATDARLFPAAALAFIRTARPARSAIGRIEWKPVSRFVLNQDTGGAIRGPGRVDLFWGRGPEAELAAGLMREPGTLYFLVPRAAGDGAVRR